MLMELAQLGCQWKYTGLCVTSVRYENASQAAHLSRNLSQYFTGNWMEDFDGLMQKLWLAMVHVNSTRVDLSVAEGLASWIRSAMNHLKEWVGIAALSFCLVLVSCLALWFILKMRMQQRNANAMIVQAFTALEGGQSPQIWLSYLKSSEL